jgi:chemotaxis family two-component system response regulator Rcp1
MSWRSELLSIDRHDDVIILRLQGDPETFHAADYGELLNHLAQEFQAQDDLRVVIDVTDLDAAGSTTVAFLVLLWKQINAGQGRMALAGVGKALEDALHFSNLDTFWKCYRMRDEALAALRSEQEATVGTAQAASSVPVEQPERLVEILLVEDNPGDARLVVEGLKEAKLPNRVHVVGDGESALAFVHRHDPYTDAPRPDLILLDLNLPKKSGREVLAEIRGDMNLKSLPIVVLTASQADEDIIRSYDLNVNAYIIKPALLHKFVELLQSLNQFWLAKATFPPK